MKVENKQINQKKQDSEGMSSDNPSEFLKTSRIMKKPFQEIIPLKSLGSFIIIL